MALRLSGLDRRGNSAIGTAPTHNQQLALLGPFHFGRRNLLRDFRHLLMPDAHHLFVVGRSVADIAGQIILFNAADTVLKTRCSRFDPRSGQGFFIPQIGKEALRISPKLDRDTGQVVNARQEPGLRGVGQESVGQQDDRRHILHRDPGRLKGGVKTVRRC